MGRGNRIRGHKAKLVRKAEIARQKALTAGYLLAKEDADKREWVEFGPDFDYVKQHYWYRLPDGSAVLCWPNAGIMNSVDGSGREWTTGPVSIIPWPEWRKSHLKREP